MQIIDCKTFASNWKKEIKEKVDGKELSLAIVQVGDNPASNSYIKGKVKDCEEVGIAPIVFQINENISEENLIEKIRFIQSCNDGIIVQLPLPKHINVKNIIKIIDPKKDVDGFTLESPYTPCTPLGIMKILKNTLINEWNTTLEGKNVVVIGRSDIVGRPVAKLLCDANATVTLCHSHTTKYDLIRYARNADIVIVAVGKPKFLTANQVYGDSIIIDVGINMVDGHLVGDVDRESFLETNPDNVFLTPVPSGVGLLTRCALLENMSKTIQFKK